MWSAYTAYDRHGAQVSSRLSRLSRPDTPAKPWSSGQPTASRENSTTATCQDLSAQGRSRPGSGRWNRLGVGESAAVGGGRTACSTLECWGNPGRATPKDVTAGVREPWSGHGDRRSETGKTMPTGDDENVRKKTSTLWRDEFRSQGSPDAADNTVMRWQQPSLPRQTRLLEWSPRETHGMM